MAKSILTREGAPPHVADFVEKVRASRGRQGNELTVMQEAVAFCIGLVDPKHVASSRDALARIAASIAQDGVWTETEEWRIGTWFDIRIAKTEKRGKDWYETSVECDGQKLACGCPTLGKAHAFVHLYKDLIIGQFYSVGPPWADNQLYES